MNEFVNRVVIPTASILFWAALFRPLCMESGECDYLNLWWFMGIPFSIHRMYMWVLPEGHDIGSSMGILAVNVLVGGMIGGIVLVWRLLVAAVYLLKTAMAVVKWTVIKLAGKPCRT